MARKAKEKKDKNYFGELEEQAVKDYLSASTQEERERVFNTYLKAPFDKMVECIIRRYGLFIPDEEYDLNKNDTFSFLMTKISKFNPESGFKAYSYCGTICKNYLIMKSNKYIKQRDMYDSYEILQGDLNDNIKLSYLSDSEGKIEFLTQLIQLSSKEIKKILDEREERRLNENNIKIGKAIVELLDNWDELCMNFGSNKFNKSSILLFLQETTLLNVKEIRKGMQIYKDAYLRVKKKLLDDNY